eukprot:406902_1
MASAMTGMVKSMKIMTKEQKIKEKRLEEDPTRLKATNAAQWTHDEVASWIEQMGIERYARWTNAIGRYVAIKLRCAHHSCQEDHARDLRIKEGRVWCDEDIKFVSAKRQYSVELLLKRLKFDGVALCNDINIVCMNEDAL